MSEFLGVDTSNYTTSSAIFDSDSREIFQKKKLLPVKSGECGLRQSDAVFHHVKQFSEICSSLLEKSKNVKAVGVSIKPRDEEKSYMPCFLVGKMSAEVIASALDARLYYTSHQQGHVAAALYSCGKLSLLKEKFIAFHVSGGTTECLLCTPDKDEIIKTNLFSHSLDLKAGQAIDRVGVMLGLQFPCGKQLEELAEKSDKCYKIKACMKGNNCCLSGLENKCRKMIDENNSYEDIAKFCLSFVAETIKEMTKFALNELGNLPVVYAGGVMSDRYIKNVLENEFDAFFAKPEFSCDNAAGISIIAYEKYKRENGIC